VILLLCKALPTEKEEILKLYSSVIGTPFCVWNENYPSMLEIDNDIKNGYLFVEKENDEIIGAISITPENEYNELNVWKNRNAREISRVVVSPLHRGKSIAYNMVLEVEKIVKDLGFEATHLLVAKKNIPAFKTYMKANYTVVGETFMYDNEYFAIEKIL